MGSNHRPADYEQAAETPFPLYIALIFDGIYSACLAGFPPEMVNLSTIPIRGDKRSGGPGLAPSHIPQCFRVSGEPSHRESDPFCYRDKRSHNDGLASACDPTVAGEVVRPEGRARVLSS